MKKTKLTRSLLAACSIVALTAVMYGCVHDGGSDDPPPVTGEPEPTAYDAGLAAIQAATTAEAAQAAYDAVDQTAISGQEAASLKTALASRLDTLATAAREAEQKMALMAAADMIDTSDLSTAEAIAAATTAINALKAAIAAAVDVDDTSMYQTMVDNAETAVMTAQGHLDTQGRMMAQRMAISNAVTMARTAVVGVDDDSTDSEVASADSAIAALEAAIEAAADLPEGDADVASAQGTLATLKGTLSVAKASRTEALEAAAVAMAKANAALGKNLRASIVDNPPAAPARQNGIFTLSVDGKLTINSPSSGAPGRFEGDDYPANPPENWAGDSAAALGGWAGTSYTHTHATTKVVNEARVYNNQGPGKTVTFAKAYPDRVHAGDTGGDDVKGYVTIDETADLARVGGATFTHSGTQSHTYDADSEVGFTTRGTFDGAPGVYRCVDATGNTCSSTNDGKGSPSALGGVWHFKPDAGAMVMQPDANYLYYGWWVNKNKDGEPMLATAFVGAVGTVANGGDLTAVTGSATYAGNAAGKWAMSNVLDGTGNGGHFTADAELKATFGDGATAGVTGTIDNFRLNDGTEDPGWSVALQRGALGDTGGTIGAGAPGSQPETVWSIDDNKAPASGNWLGTMYDELPGDPPDGDGSNLPTTVTGTFYSEFSTIGRMVGAFGAEKQ